MSGARPNPKPLSGSIEPTNVSAACVVVGTARDASGDACDVSRLRSGTRTLLWTRRYLLSFLPEPIITMTSYVYLANVCDPVVMSVLGRELACYRRPVPLGLRADHGESLKWHSIALVLLM